MLDILTKSAIDRPSIPTHAPARVLETYIKMVYAESTSLLAFLSGDQLVKFGVLCDRMQSDGLDKLLRKPVDIRVFSDPSTVSIFAPQKNDVKLEARAIRLFGERGWCPTDSLHTLSDVNISGLEPSWLVSLFRCRLGGETVCGGYGEGYLLAE